MNKQNLNEGSKLAVQEDQAGWHGGATGSELPTLMVLGKTILDFTARPCLI